ncbi:hypothetical protein Pmani_028457 [Petrolisthes manimaculis]|uniref:Uncharacterized protein n=1 Tax=Petrolisthes manimaculis TaxID=1843537 RepID=A0AAE1P284_9EUCA|nr:hypothetical protein Pmani_028457 [Petrolisthes manimaculis]
MSQDPREEQKVLRDCFRATGGLPVATLGLYHQYIRCGGPIQRQSSQRNSTPPIKMNCYLFASLALVAALVGLTDSTIVLATGAGLTVSAAAALGAAGVAAVGALALGAAAVIGLANKRGKRETISCLPFNNPELFFSIAANTDFLDCGRRYLCELEATPVEFLAEEEMMIRDVFGQGSTSINGSAGSFYAEASTIGINGGVAACVQSFSSCPFDRKTIFLAFEEAKKAQNQIKEFPKVQFLTELTWLNLEENNIRSLPLNLFGTLSFACELWINNNPLSDVAAGTLLPLPNTSQIRTNASVFVWARDEDERTQLLGWE